MRAPRKANTIRLLVICNLLLWMPAFYAGANAAAQVAAKAPMDAAQVEKGRQVVAQVCSSCHTTIMRMVQVHRQTEEQWRSLVFFMISRGAQVMPDEIEPVAAYLTTVAGPGVAVETTAAPGGPGGGRGGAGRGGAGGAGGQQAADAGGRAIMQRTCQQCHELATASGKRPDEQWSDVLTRMMNYGARLSPADHDALLQYLGTLTR